MIIEFEINDESYMLNVEKVSYIINKKKYILISMLHNNDTLTITHGKLKDGRTTQKLYDEIQFEMYKLKTRKEKEFLLIETLIANARKML